MTACLDSIKICALRVTALDDSGNVASGPNNFVALNRLMTLGWTPDIDAGKDLFYRNGCDAALGSYKSQPLLKRFTLALALFGLEAAVQSLLTGAPVIDDTGGDVIGFEANVQNCPDAPNTPLVAVEAWSWAVSCGDVQDGDTPWWYYVWPASQWSFDQENLLQTDFLQPHLAGFTRQNPLWGHGPYGGIVKGAAGGSTFLSNGSMATFLTSTDPPADECGFQTVVPGS